MPTLSGTITEQEYLAYGGAEISLMNNLNDNTTSGGSLSGEGTYTWSISWDENGFSGKNWKAFGGTDMLQELGTIEAIVEDLNSRPVIYAISVATTNYAASTAGCATAERTDV